MGHFLEDIFYLHLHRGRMNEYYSLNMLINQDEKQTSCFLDGKSLGNPANSC